MLECSPRHSPQVSCHEQDRAVRHGPKGGQEAILRAATSTNGVEQGRYSPRLGSLQILESFADQANTVAGIAKKKKKNISTLTRRIVLPLGSWHREKADSLVAGSYRETHKRDSTVARRRTTEATAGFYLILTKMTSTNACDP